MSLKPPKKSDLGKSWMKNRTPQYHHLLEPGTTCSILVGGWKFPYRLPAQCEQSGTQP